jgi:hypothetical protein
LRLNNLDEVGYSGHHATDLWSILPLHHLVQAPQAKAANHLLGVKVKPNPTADVFDVNRLLS